MCGCSGGSSSVKQTQKQQAARGSSAPRMQQESQAPGNYRPGDVMVKVKFREGSPRRADGTPYGYMVQGEQWWVSENDLAAHSNWFQLAAMPEPA